MARRNSKSGPPRQRTRRFACSPAFHHRACPSGRSSTPRCRGIGKWLAQALTDGLTTNIWALSTATGEWRQITDFGDRPTFIARRVSWSSDGRSILAAVGDGDSDIVLLEGLTNVETEVNEVTGGSAQPRPRSCLINRYARSKVASEHRERATRTARPSRRKRFGEVSP